MFTAITTVLLTFILTGLVGSRLIHGLQHRNWLAQQRILNREREHNAVQAISDEIVNLGGRRQYRMVRLARSLRSADLEIIRLRLKDYDEALVAWNDHLGGIYAKLAMHFDWYLTTDLEKKIQNRFNTIGQRLERLTEQRLKNGKVDNVQLVDLEKALNILHGQLGKFHRRILKEIEARKNAEFLPKQLRANNLDSFPTWELFKALFEPAKKRS